MKLKYWLWFVCLSTSVTISFAQNKSKVTINQATVFLSGAQLEGIAKFNYIKQGSQQLIISGLPSDLNPQNINLAAKGDFVVMGSRFEINYLKNKHLKKISKINDSLDIVQFQRDSINYFNEVLKKEENAILNNQKIGGDNIGTKVNDINDLALYIHKKLPLLKSQELKNNLKIKKLDETITTLQNQLNTENGQDQLPTGELIVNIVAKEATNAVFELSFVTYSAYWLPAYDIKAKDTKNPLNINFKANVMQNTGTDWENIKLTLSTGNPSAGGTRPQLYPWYLQVQDIVYKRTYSSKAAAPMMLMNEQNLEMSKDKVMGSAQNTSNYVTVSNSTLTKEYEINLPYSVPTGNLSILVPVKDYQINANYQYICVPKMDKDVFLVAKSNQLANLNLTAGSANIYFENMFVGETYLNPDEQGDTLEVSLGRDKKILVKRELKKEYTSKKLIGNDKVREYEYEISVKNTSKESIIIEIQDQLPISKDNRISVNDIEIKNNGDLDKESGKISWKLNVATGQTSAIRYSYSVKYPKEKIVLGL